MENKELTPEEQNLIKDMLQFFGNASAIERQFQRKYKYLNQDFYNCLCDSIFNKLQNGRLTVVEN